MAIKKTKSTEQVSKKTLKGRTTFREVTPEGKIKVNNRPEGQVPIGKIITELRKDDAAIPKTVGEIKEQSKCMTEDYVDNLKLAVENGKKAFNKDFFVTVLTKAERLLTGVIRNYFHPRVTCPDPNYDQALYLYDSSKEEIEFLWVIPDKDVCSHMYTNRYNSSREDLKLLPYVVDFVEGRLHVKQVKFNKKVEANL